MRNLMSHDIGSQLTGISYQLGLTDLGNLAYSYDSDGGALA